MLYPHAKPVKCSLLPQYSSFHHSLRPHLTTTRFSSLASIPKDLKATIKGLGNPYWTKTLYEPALFQFAAAVTVKCQKAAEEDSRISPPAHY